MSVAAAIDHNNELIRMAIGALTVKHGGRLVLTEQDLNNVPNGSLIITFGEGKENGSLICQFIEQKAPGEKV